MINVEGMCEKVWTLPIVWPLPGPILLVLSGIDFANSVHNGTRSRMTLLDAQYTQGSNEVGEDTCELFEALRRLNNRLVFVWAITTV
jgi:hypothetical protein